jgi:hypothetical protein
MKCRAEKMLVIVAVFTAAAGCGGDGPSLAPLSGTVSVAGQPLASGLVQFVPEAPTGPPAVGSVEAGRFTARTAGRAGAVPGRYRIRVEARMAAADETDTLPRSLVAGKYLDPSRSGLTCEVIAGQDNVLELTLEPAPGAAP